MSIIDIESVLPHRYPFLMVDSVTVYEKNCSLLAIKNISKNEPALQGHFPGRAVFPGVLIIEALAQAAGILWAKSNCEVMQSKTNCYLAGTDKTKFKRKVIPGDQLYLDIKVVCLKRQIMKADAIASVNGDIACSTTISLFVECNEQERHNNFSLPDYLCPVRVWSENKVLCTVHE